MPDKSVPLEATDLYSLGGNFSPQSSSSMTTEENANILDEFGNVACETSGLNTTTEYPNSFGYCGTDIRDNLGVFLSQFGNVQNGKLITQLVINFSAGVQATVDITGHNHAENDHIAGADIGYADVSAAVPASAGFGVPTFPGVTLGAEATPISATLTFAMNHIDRPGEDGNHWVGKNLTPRCDLTIEYQGAPSTSEPVTNFTTDSDGGADANQEFDTHSYAGHIFFDLAV